MSDRSTGTTGLTGMQKAAVVLMQMGQERASQVMKQFTDQEAEEITAEIVRLHRVDADVAREALTEFHSISLEGNWRTHGGQGFATTLLESSFGAERAASLMDRVASTVAGKSFEFLDLLEPGQVLNLVEDELPQTIALVLAHLRPSNASAVLSQLAEPRRTDVAQCIATMGAATPELVQLVAETVKSRAGAIGASRSPVQVVGGVQPLVDIINRSEVQVERALLDGLDLRDPELAEEVRSRMLVFADIVNLEDRDVQRVLRGIDMTALAIALKGTAPEVADAVRANLSERNRELLDDEIAAAGPARTSQVDEARAEVVRAIRQLDADGDITVRRGPEDDYVA